MGIFKNAIEEGRKMGLKMYLDELPPEQAAKEKAELLESDPELYAELFGSVPPLGTLTFTVKAETGEGDDD